METKDKNKYAEFARARNKVKAISKRAQKELERNICGNLKDNPETFLGLSQVPHPDQREDTRIMGAIRRSFTDLNSDNFWNLFTTMIRPHLEYAAAVWSPHMKKDIQLIENVQRRATKQLPKKSKLPYSERLRQLDLPTLRYRCIRGDMIDVFKILKYYDSDPNQILQRHTSSATRGHSLKLAKKQSNSNLRLYSFSIRVINNWNNLSNHVVSSSNTNK